MKKFLLTCMAAFFYSVSAQVGPPQTANPNTNNGYGFVQSLGTYTPLSAGKTVWQSGTVLNTDAASAAISLPAPFKYNGKTYTSIYISNNGYITFGIAPSAGNTSVLTTNTAFEGAVAGFTANLRAANTTTSEIAYETIGSKFVVQYTDLQSNSGSSAQKLNFQIVLDTTDNTVEILYGDCTSGTSTLSGQVGLKGGESSDLNNRVGTDWTNTAAGAGSTTTSCTLGTTNGNTVPASGLSFKYTPGTWVGTPSYASMPYTETFSAWGNGNSVGDLPNASNWRSWPSRGDNSWRSTELTVANAGFTSVSGWNDVSETTATPISSPATAPAARFHSYHVSAGLYGYMDLYIDLSSGTGERVLSFDYVNASGTDNLKIQLSTDGGATFTTVGTAFGTSATWSSKNVVLGSNSSTAVIRFLATGDFGSDDIFIDNVKVGAMNCLMPATVTTGTTTATTVPVNWTVTTAAPTYDIYYSTSGTAPTAASVPTFTGATGTTQTLTGLTPSSTYYLWVRSNCGADQSIWVYGSTFSTKTFCPSVSAPSSSATAVALKPTFTWAANADATGYKLSIGTTAGGTDVLNAFDVGNVTTYTLPNELAYNTKYYYTINSYNATQTSTGCTERNFTTLSICPTVSAPASSAADVSLSPTFTWSAVTGVNGYKLRIGTTPGGTDVMNNVDVGNVTTYTLPTVLNNSTTYYYSVGAYTATQSSTNCTERNFSTVCGTVTSFSENFDGVAAGSWPACWGKVGTAGSANIQTSSMASAPNVLYIYSSTTSNIAVVKMRPVSALDTGLYRLRFKARSNSTVGGKVEVGYLTDPTTASSFVSLGIFTTTSISVLDNFIINNITAPAGTTTLAFRHTGSPANSILIDDVNYEPIPACSEPTALVASAVLAQSADISWTAPATAPGSGYEIYYSTSNVAPTAATAATITNITATSRTLSGLTPNTTYNVWVRSNCNGTDKGAWVGTAIFTTACLAVVPAYTNDFSTFPGTCWSQASGGTPATGPTGASALWIADGFLNSGTTGAAKMNIYNDNRVGWLKTAAFDLSAGGYKVEFDYAVTDYADTVSSPMGSDDTVQFVVSTDGGTTWTVLNTWTAANGPSNALNTYSLDLTGYTNPNTIFAFYGSSGTVDDLEDYDFFIDNFKISAAQLATSETKVKEGLKVYPNPFTDNINISDVSQVKSVSVIDLAGRVVKTIESPSSVLQLGDLNHGMYLAVLYMKDGSKQTFKVIKK
ncbi:fibronectin type III domain-containing protein [Chryseobacterium sp. Bi04]|uniref:fibronectin type III domain-containing protein n=1 Tax=Chryseobacterium sp. Bi04 TaxID=2822345 RepID=UPI001E3E4F13|nr:fibronectin type III domain-containing protein [Chryseobacterium sp. Bi04]